MLTVEIRDAYGATIHANVVRVGHQLRSHAGAPLGATLWFAGPNEGGWLRRKQPPAPVRYESGTVIVFGPDGAVLRTIELGGA